MYQNEDPLAMSGMEAGEGVERNKEMAVVLEAKRGEVET